MTKGDLSDIYRSYIACLNKQDWPNLGQFVHEDVHRNGRRIGLAGYQLKDGRIMHVWSVIDKAAIEAQLV